jgi:hypothetical protein
MAINFGTTHSRFPMRESLIWLSGLVTLIVSGRRGDD